MVMYSRAGSRVQEKRLFSLRLGNPYLPGERGEETL